jgi:predicted MFS family arabinose efflux permease
MSELLISRTRSTQATNHPAGEAPPYSGQFGGKGLALTCIALAQLMIALDATVVNIALPSAQAELGFSDADRQWVITAYTLTFGLLLLPGGRIADSASLGRKRAFILGLVGFALASALSGAAPNFELLVAARAVQGAFAALLAPTALSLLAVTFTEPTLRARAFGVYGGIAASGGAIGLLLGGLLTQSVDWRWCLYINVPIALSVAITASRVVHVPQPERRPRRAFETLRLLPRVVLDRRRGAAYLSALLAIAGMFGAFLFLTYEMQVVLGFSPLQAGLAFLPMSLSSLVVAMLVAPRLLPRVAPRMLMVPGFLSAAAGMAVLSQLHSHSSYLTGILPAEVLLGVGVSSVMVPASSMATGGVAPRDTGVAAATLNTSQQLGASLGTALLNTLAATATAAYLSANASAAHADGLVAGYALAATAGALIMLLGAGIAATLAR